MTQETRWLKPAHADVVVRDPNTREPLPEGGDEKPLDTYWCRRIADGDVVIASPETASKIVQPTTEEESQA